METEIAYLNAHRDELLRQYGPKYLVIHGEEVGGAFDTLQAALEGAATLYGTENVLIRQAAEPPIRFTAPAYALGILHADSPS